MSKPDSNLVTMYPRDPVEERYRRDPEFHHLVAYLEQFIDQARFSPSELREAVMLAATRYEIRTNRSSFVLKEDEIRDFIERSANP